MKHVGPFFLLDLAVIALRPAACGQAWGRADRYFSDPCCGCGRPAAVGYPGAVLSAPDVVLFAPVSGRAGRVWGPSARAWGRAGRADEAAPVGRWRGERESALRDRREAWAVGRFALRRDGRSAEPAYRDADL